MLFFISLSVISKFLIWLQRLLKTLYNAASRILPCSRNYQRLRFLRAGAFCSGQATPRMQRSLSLRCSVYDIGLSFTQSGDGWKNGICADHGFTTRHGTGLENGVEVQVNYWVVLRARRSNFFKFTTRCHKVVEKLLEKLQLTWRLHSRHLPQLAHWCRKNSTCSYRFARCGGREGNVEIGLASGGRRASAFVGTRRVVAPPHRCRAGRLRSCTDSAASGLCCSCRMGSRALTVRLLPLFSIFGCSREEALTSRRLTWRAADVSRRVAGAINSGWRYQ